MVRFDRYRISIPRKNILSNCTDGITIHNESCNVFCYADDLIICSLSISGLQDMINAAKSYL